MRTSHVSDMRPPLKNFGGHPQFQQYRTWFRNQYCDPGKPVFDAVKRRVLFDQYPPFEDAAHVCYGAPKENAGDPNKWKEDRAERMAWIELAVTQPNFIVKSSSPNGQLYLLYLEPDPGTAQVPEYYCVVVNVYDSKPGQVEFVTAYDIDYKKYDRMRDEGDRIYPKLAPRPRKKKKPK